MHTQVKRSTILVIAAVAAVVLAIIAAVIMLTSGSSTPATYRVETHGNLPAHWSSDSGTGLMDSGVHSITASRFEITVSSTDPSDGASCEIRDASGKMIDYQIKRAAVADVTSASVTCKTP